MSQILTACEIVTKMTSNPPLADKKHLCTFFLRRISCWKVKFLENHFIHVLAMTSQTSKIYTFMAPQWMVTKLSCTEWAALLQKAQSLRFKSHLSLTGIVVKRYQVHRFGPLLPHAFSSKPFFLFLKGFLLYFCFLPTLTSAFLTL